MRAPATAVLLLAVAAGLPLSVDAQSGTAASVEPGAAVPGENILLTYTTASPGVVDIAVQRTPSCTIEAPDGTTTDCSAETTLLTIHVAPGAESYSWQIPAPDAVGVYTATFQMNEVASVPGASQPARATFEVRGPPTDQPPELVDPSSDGGDDATPAGPADDDAPSHAPRMVLTTLMGAGSFVLLILASRFGDAP